MYAERILTQVLASCLVNLHAKRASALSRTTAALLHGGVASLSAIAGKLRADTALKHRIKSVDRLLGNTGIHLMRSAIYQSLAARWLNGLPQVLLVVDWSDLTRDQRWQLLRASFLPLPDSTRQQSIAN